MRLKVPRVTSVASKGGKAVLHYRGSSMHPDVVGAIYVLEIEQPEHESGKVAIEVVVASKGTDSISQAAQAGGLDYDNMSLPQKGKFLDKFFQENGKYDRVKEFYTEGILDYAPEAIITLREIFVKLYFEMTSSYRFNDEDGDEKSGYYDDMLDFNPIPLLGKYPMTYRSRDIMGEE